MPVRHGSIWQPGPGSLVDHQHPLGRGCVGCWIAGATHRGNYWQDISGQQNHGTLTNMDAATDWVSDGDRGWALDFDNSNDIVYCGLGIPAFTVGYSIVTRLVLAANDTARFAQRFGTNESVRHAFVATSLRAEFGISTTGSSTTNYNSANNIVTPGTWLTYAAVWKPSRIQHYKDGALITDQAGPATIYDNSAVDEYALGGTVPWNGQIASTMIYDRALSATEVEQLYYQPYSMIWTPGRRKTFLLGAAAASGLSVELADGVSLMDALLAQAAFNASLTDTVQVADTITPTAAYLITATDGLTAADTLTPTAAFATSLADDLRAADGLTALGAYGVELADALDLADSIAATKGVLVVLADGLDLADTLAVTQGHLVDLADGLALSDDLDATAAYTILLVDSVQLADVLRFAGAALVPPLQATDIRVVSLSAEDARQLALQATSVRRVSLE